MRRVQVKEAELVISGILSRIGRKGEADPARLVLGSLHALIEARSGIDAAWKSAENELSEARRRIDEARLVVDRKHSVMVRHGCRHLRKPLRRCGWTIMPPLAARSSVAHLETLADRLRALKPWQGNVQQLADIVVPDNGTIEHWKSAEVDVRKEVELRTREVERLITERLRLRV